MQTVEIVKALRCISTEGNVAPDCKGCPFYAREQLDPKLAEELGIIGQGEWYSCDCNAVGFAAADRLEELLGRCARYAEEIAVLRERQRWISVTERLPETDEFVLAVVNGKPSENITLVDSIEIASFMRDEGWYLDMYPEWEDPKVTHWMPLPEAPEVE